MGDGWFNTGNNATISVDWMGFSDKSSVSILIQIFNFNFHLQFHFNLQHDLAWLTSTSTVWTFIKLDFIALALMDQVQNDGGVLSSEAL